MNRIQCDCVATGVDENKMLVIQWCEKHKAGFDTPAEAQHHVGDLARDYIDAIKFSKANH